jgi:Flp pilus assembly pilin Flp
MISQSIVSLGKLGKRDDGQDLLEYSLLVSLIAIFAMTAVTLLAEQITDVFWGMISTIGDLI